MSLVNLAVFAPGGERLLAVLAGGVVREAGVEDETPLWKIGAAVP